MHDKNGREIKKGDFVRYKGWQAGEEKVGEVLSLTPAASTCNLSVASYVLVPQIQVISVTAADVEVVDFTVTPASRE